jgi:hypothetical protein
VKSFTTESPFGSAQGRLRHGESLSGRAKAARQQWEATREQTCPPVATGRQDAALEVFSVSLCLCGEEVAFRERPSA